LSADGVLLVVVLAPVLTLSLRFTLTRRAMASIEKVKEQRQGHPEGEQNIHNHAQVA